MCLGKAAFVDAIVHRFVDALIHMIDLIAQISRIEVGFVSGDFVESGIEDPNDFGAFIVDDGFLLLVPENRHGHLAGIVRLRLCVDLVQVFLPIERVSGRAGKIRLQLPSFIQHMRVNHADRDQVLESFQMAEDKRAMGPRARIGHIEMEPARLGLYRILSIRAGRAIRRDPIAEGGIFTVELAVISGELVFLLPLSVHQQARHRRLPFRIHSPSRNGWRAGWLHHGSGWGRLAHVNH